MAFQVFHKDPDAKLDYKVDFAASTNNGGSSDYEDYLEDGETIDSIVTVFADSANITIDSYSLFDGNTSVVVWLSGGVAGEVYRVTTRIQTVEPFGRMDDRSIIIVCREF